MINTILHILTLVLLFTNQSYSFAATLIDPPTIIADGGEIYCPNTYHKIANNVTITHDPSETSTDAVYIQIASGYVNGQDILKLNDTYTAAHPTITSYFKPLKGN